MDEIGKKQIEALEEEISDERDKLSTDRMDISFGELINLYKNGELIIRPEYQRLFRWTPKQKTAFIESILLSIPIPPIFVAEDQEGIWELVDGLHRVATFISFFGELNDDEEGKIGNKWTLEVGGLVKSLERFDIDTLPGKYKINLKRAVCRVEILREKSNISMKYELVKRLNSGGSKATPQEIRNAIYRAVNPAINDFMYSWLCCPLRLLRR
jgi:uncharacterized protein with ParB-like and HNH nuclease domain